MAELKILDSLFDENVLSRIKSSLQYDYLGAVIILITLLKQKDALHAARAITHSGPIFAAECLMCIWLNLHSISHNTKFIGQFFQKSIEKSKHLRKKHVKKCHWTLCKKWRNADKFYRCKKCKAVTYCSKSCQKKAWNKGFHSCVCNEY